MSPFDDAPTASRNGHPDSTTDAHTPPDPFETWVNGVPAGRYSPAGADPHKTGGLGQVFKVRDPVIGREVAVKRLRPDRTGAAVRARFVREAEITGRLEHPNIVPLYDLLAGADGPAYVMRFVDGETLAEAARGYHKRRAKKLAGPLELPRLLGAVVQVCEAVAYAHSKGVLHRDLKGQNVLLGQFGEVCLADWGLAKVVGEPDQPGDPSPLSPSPDQATEPGAVMGTPQFMAPELARAEPASHASDIYALGAVLYQVLTDRTPHTGNSSTEVLSSLKAGQPVPPARQVNPAAPAALAAVCHKALSDDPADRYGSAGALAADLRAYLAGEPVGAYPEPLADRAWRLARRYRGWAAGAAAGLVVAVAVTTVAAVLLYREKERTAAEKRAADAARSEAETSRDIAVGLSDAVFDLVTATETGRAGGGSVEARRQATGRAVAAAERLAAGGVADPTKADQLAQLLWYAGNLARLSSDPAAAEAAYRAAERLLRQHLAGDPAVDRRRVLGGVLTDLAVCQTTYGRLKPALGTLAAADREVAGGASAWQQRTAALAGLMRSDVLVRLGRFDEAATAAGAAADGFARLAADPAGRHFMDPTLHGAARMQAATIGRERVRVVGGDRAAVAADADAAADLLRLAAEADARRDVRANYLHGLARRAEYRRWAGRPATDARADLDRAVAGLDALQAADPGVAFLRHWLAQALTARADEVAAAGDPAAAVRDLTRAKDLLWTLATSEDKVHPEYHADLAVASVGLGRLAGSQEAAKRPFLNAAVSARKAVGLSPDDVPYPRLRDEVYEAADRAGVNVRDPRPRPAGR